MKHIVIIGGGFGGLNMVKQLAGKKGCKVTLVDRNNYNFFPPLMYQIATGMLEAGNISYPFRKLLRGMTNIRFQMGEFKKLVPEENRVILSTGELLYDYIVFATGVYTNYFGMENVKQHALPMKTVHDAIRLRNHVLMQLELAATTPDILEREKLLTIVVAGGGPTGVELSGMLADLRKYVMHKDYPEIVEQGLEPKIILVDGVDVVLKPMSDKSHKHTYKALIEMGVQVKLNMQVKDYTNDAVIFANGEKILTRSLVWAAGVTGGEFPGIPTEAYGRGKRLSTDGYNCVMGFKNVFAIGDIAIQKHEAKFGSGHPQLAQVAIQQGVNLAKNLIAAQKGQPMKPFKYWDKGTMAIIGRNRAVVDIPNKIHFHGFIAWMMWLFVHLLSLATQRSRVTTLYNWMVNLFTKDQALRMIIRSSDNSK